jgi:sigma-B regulation protein RsbU (phosphoserine phosphatase)
MKPNQTTIRKGNILIVDDVPANLRLLSNILSNQGYQVRPVPDGSLAIESAQAEIPDLILLDIRMPGLNGYQVCKILKSDERTREVPIIFISALDTIQDKIKAFSMGGVDYITKPFHSEEITARVDSHLALRNLQRQLQDANLKMELEMKLAGEVQMSYLPRDVPTIPGWHLAVTLKPARETSGDFYDINRLPNGRIGILIADVVDKGVSAALFMALCYILIRTYASDFSEQPELVFNAVNKRILEDTNAKQFLTAFYGILNPNSGEMIYSNAGQCPSLFFSAQHGSIVQTLLSTGPPLGVFDHQSWGQGSIHIAPGDVLVLYTDGIIEAQNHLGAFYGETRLLDSVSSHLGHSAEQVQAAILSDLNDFTGNITQQDDIGLVIVQRK